MKYLNKTKGLNIKHRYVNTIAQKIQIFNK